VRPGAASAISWCERAVIVETHITVCSATAARGGHELTVGVVEAQEADRREQHRQRERVAEHCRLRRDNVDVHEHARPERPPLEGTEVCTERRLALGAPREIRPRAGLGEAFDPDWWVKGADPA